MSSDATQLKPYQWKQGQSGNPNGRPKKTMALTNALKEYSELKDETGKTYREKLTEKLYSMALEEGDIIALKYIYDRVEGKPKETIEHEGAIPAVVSIPQELMPEKDEQ